MIAVGHRPSAIGSRLAGTGLWLAACSLWLSVASADITRDLDAIAGELAKPKALNGKTLVVLNLPRVGGGETQNSVDLAAKLTGSLARVGAKRFSVINRAAAEKMFFEEQKYNASELNSSQLARLLEQLGADVGVTGEYMLIGNQLALENLQVQAVPDTNQKPVLYSAITSRKVKFTPADSTCAYAREILLPLPPDSTNQAFLTLETDSLYAIADLTDEEGRIIRDNCVRIGTYYRLAVDVKRDAFIYALNYDEDLNRAYLLYPLERELAPKSKGRLQLPEGRVQYEAIAPAGRGSVLIFACLKPLDFKIPTSQNYELSPDDIASLARQLKSAAKSDWSRYVIFVHVMP